MARIENNVIHDQIFETDIGKTSVDVDHVLNRLIEIDIGITDIHQSRRFHVVVLALEVFDVFGEPQR